MKNHKISFKTDKTHVLCQIGDDCYKLEQFNTEPRQEWITRLFFNHICSGWDVDEILNSMIYDDFFKENVISQLTLSLHEATDILIRYKVAGDKKQAELLIEFLVKNNIYGLENDYLIFFPNMEISSKSYLHSLGAYLDSMMDKLMILEKSVKTIKEEDIFHDDIDTMPEEFNKSTTECIKFLNNALDKGLNPSEISQLIYSFNNFLELNKLVYLNKSGNFFIKIDECKFEYMNEKIDYAIALVKETKQSVNLIKRIITPELEMAMKLRDIEPMNI